jgi:hypothetical protein
MAPSPSMSGTTPASVTISRSWAVKDGEELATTHPLRKCVTGLNVISRFPVRFHLFRSPIVAPVPRSFFFPRFPLLESILGHPQATPTVLISIGALLLMRHSHQVVLPHNRFLATFRKSRLSGCGKAILGFIVSVRLSAFIQPL